MNILLVSQCHKNALTETRRILDQFAQRKGDRTWQTAITFEGLKTLRKMLQKNARRNTAVSCHWLKKNGQCELIWIVGRLSAFDEQGNVATNSTTRSIIKNKAESAWQSAEVIALAAGIAGLFHDFGKANALFQRKLTGDTKSFGEPYRHEWVSLRLFEAFAGTLDDQGWLTRLTRLKAIDEKDVLSALKCDGLGSAVDLNMHRSAFISLEGKKFARLVAWLIVSHHRLPVQGKNPLCLADHKDWLHKSFYPSWNSVNHEKDWSEADIKANWTFPHGTPICSAKWRKKAGEIASRALKHPNLQAHDWLHQRFTSHLARLSLILCDHYYSSLDADASPDKWRDDDYHAYANTDSKSPKKIAPLKQKLDEHNIGVGQNALFFARNLSALKRSLPAIARHKTFSKRSADAKYRWQDKAFDLASSLGLQSEQQGFFGINMASTGCGKTFANARIMYGLNGDKQGCRFSVALGLRTLTLQTGDAYRDLLKLDDSDLAVLIGSQAVKDLHELNKDQAKADAKRLKTKTSEKGEQKNTPEDHGSESAEEFSEHMYVSYDGGMYEGRLKQWLNTGKKSQSKLSQLISAPILVSTIDHLIPATDSLRGGKQIAPMLRLLTSDLVLDEPDDFGLEDLPALCRLVNWAGVLGSRVLLSSATLPPALVTALFCAYREGRKHYEQVNISGERDQGIICAWFDEYGAQAQTILDKKAFKAEHKLFVTARANQLTKKPKLRQGEIVPIDINAEPNENKQALKQAAAEQMAQTIWTGIHRLHKQHHVTHKNGQQVSLGVVRMANIGPLVAVAKQLTARSPEPDVQIHYCVYHGQFPLALRSFIESRLDAALTRYDPEALWEQTEITKALAKSSAKHHIFVVLGTSVVEVGRDHDYDWAIAEPSSLRAVIQLAGRVQRHRQQVPSSPNILLLSKNNKALQGITPAYCRPGFESVERPLAHHDLTDLLNDELNPVTAIPRILEPSLGKKDMEPNSECTNWNLQEHRALAGGLFKSKKQASYWWEAAIDWTGEYIKQTPFRQSEAQEQYVLWWPEDESPVWAQLDDTRHPWLYTPSESDFEPVDLNLADGVNWWLDLDPERIYTRLSDALEKPCEQISKDFGSIALRAKDDDASRWYWHSQLGVHDA